MTAVEEYVETVNREADQDDLPLAHVPTLDWLTGSRTTRPDKALCGAELLGIEAFPPYKNCDECWELWTAILKEWT